MGALRLRLAVCCLALTAANFAHAQVDVQKFRIDKVILKFVTNKPSTNRCLLWFPFDSTKTPITEFDEDGSPFARVQLHARVRGKDCNVSFRPQEAMKLVKQEQNDLYFEVTVRPPITVIDFNGFFNGPDFRDQLIFETVSESLEEIDFFTFFKKSKVYFESRYATTSSTSGLLASNVHILPVFGGKIGVPFPWIDRLIFDFSMYQNLGNLKPNPDVRFQYSEFAFGMNYVWSGKESWGRPQAVPALEYRGRNSYQTYVSSNVSASGAKKPFYIGALTVPGVGADLGWFPGGAFYPWEHWLSRVGIDLTYRYYIGGKIALGTHVAPIASNFWDIGMQYRLTRKWAIGGGYSKFSQSFDIKKLFPDAESARLKEPMTNYYVRLILVPYIVEGDE